MLAQGTIDRALEEEAKPQTNVGRAVINGAVVIYDLDQPPEWLKPLLDARDEDGNVAILDLGTYATGIGAWARH